VSTGVHLQMSPLVAFFMEVHGGGPLNRTGGEFSEFKLISQGGGWIKTRVGSGRLQRLGLSVCHHHEHRMSSTNGLNPRGQKVGNPDWKRKHLSLCSPLP
jgi:hypothetical protein